MNTLTASQREAIESDHSNILVLAGPGSGKTQVTVERIRRLIEHSVNPERIAAITFTNAAAREMEERLQTVEIDLEETKEARERTPMPPGFIGISRDTAPGPLGHVGTLHSFAFRCLKQHGAVLGYGARLSVISPESAQDLLEQKARSLGCKEPLKRLLEIKATGIDPANRTRLPETVVAAHLQEMKEAGIVDFDVLLTEFNHLLIKVGWLSVLGHEFDYLFVDEVQDSSPIDWEIYENLPILHKFFVGDPDQAIYGFRGGAVSEVVRYAAEPDVQVIRLEENFRSRSEICGPAQLLIEHNQNRIPKATISTRGTGGYVRILPETANEGEEIAVVCRGVQNWIDAEYISSDDIAILARTNAIAAAFQKTLDACGIPVRKRVESDLPRDFALARAMVEFMAEPRNDTLAWLYLHAKFTTKGVPPHEARRLAHNIVTKAQAVGKCVADFAGDVPKGIHAFSATAALAATGGSAECVMFIAEKLQQLPPNASMSDLALLLARPDEGAKEEGEGVHVLTIHGAKGQEFRAVFVVGMEDETCPSHRKDVDLEEERRLVYVASTRAKDFLAFSFCRSRVTPWGQIVPMRPSRFLSELSAGVGQG
jgi:DNA helicase-2/ATP-dependent DNA helicase PcrA